MNTGPITLVAAKIPMRRPVRPVPDVENPNERPALSGREAPLDIHPSRHTTTNVTESDRRRGVVDLHLRKPPRWPAKRPKKAIGRHLDQTTAVGRIFPKSDVAVVREVCRPLLHVPNDLERGANGGADELLVDRLHRAPGRHGAELVRWPRRQAAGAGIGH